MGTPRPSDPNTPGQSTRVARWTVNPLLRHDHVWSGEQRVVADLGDGRRGVLVELNLSARVEPDEVFADFLRAYRARVPDAQQPERRPRLHLFGHSFGARLVAYALSGLDQGLAGTASPVKSLLLIQGAFSHFSFNPTLAFDPDRAGALAGYQDRVDGPLLSTFTAYDRAVGWWYPLASMLKRQDASSQAELLYRWGAMGADGYQVDDAKLVRLAEDGFPYGFTSGGFYRLDANSVINTIRSPFTGAHSDICHPEVAWAAIAASGLVGTAPHP